MENNNVPLLLSIVLILLAETNATYTCRTIGRFPDLTDVTCKKYFYCNKTIAGTLWATPCRCPANSNFDPNTRKCSMTYPCGTDRVPVDLIKFFPPQFTCTSPGLFPDLNDDTCKRYFRCVRLFSAVLYKLAYNCQNSLFDPVLRKCSQDYDCQLYVPFLYTNYSTPTVFNATGEDTLDITSESVSTPMYSDDTLFEISSIVPSETTSSLEKMISTEDYEKTNGQDVTYTEITPFGLNATVKSMEKTSNFESVVSTEEGLTETISTDHVSSDVSFSTEDHSEDFTMQSTSSSAATIDINTTYFVFNTTVKSMEETSSFEEVLTKAVSTDYVSSDVSFSTKDQTEDFTMQSTSSSAATIDIKFMFNTTVKSMEETSSFESVSSTEEVLTKANYVSSDVPFSTEDQSEDFKVQSTATIDIEVTMPFGLKTTVKSMEKTSSFESVSSTEEVLTKAIATDYVSGDVFFSTEDQPEDFTEQNTSTSTVTIDYVTTSFGLNTTVKSMEETSSFKNVASTEEDSTRTISTDYVFSDVPFPNEDQSEDFTVQSTATKDIEVTTSFGLKTTEETSSFESVSNTEEDLAKTISTDYVSADVSFSTEGNSENFAVQSTASSATTENKSDFMCTTAGKFPDLEDATCSRYFLCSSLRNGTILKTTYHCPDSSFDPFLKRCSKLYECDPTRTSIPTLSIEIFTSTQTEILPVVEQTTTTDLDLKETTQIKTVKGVTPIIDGIKVFTCSEQGKFPDSSDPTCRKYYHCYELKNGTFIRTAYACPNSTFDPVSQKCSKYFDCPQLKSTTTTSIVTTTVLFKNTEALMHTTENFAVDSSPLVYDFQCSQAGRFPDLGDFSCKWYFLCNRLRNGTFMQTPYECPSNSIFDPFIQLCSTRTVCRYEMNYYEA